ncbi:hypothetical protein BX616_008138, partial [Lobosporangium transversale]
MKRLSEIFHPNSKGSRFFLSQEIIENTDPKKYVIFRSSFALQNASEVAREWNEYMAQLKFCDSSEWRDYAANALVMTRRMVVCWATAGDDGVD